MELLKTIKDPKFWLSFRDKKENQIFLDKLKKEYEETCIGEIETSKFSKFILFKDTGDRGVYQETFFKRQHRMYTMAMLCMIYPENEEYLKLLQDTIWEVCDLYVWALPAHIKNSWDEDKANSAILDLDATTMAQSLAIIKVVLGNRLRPLIVSRIDNEIDRRIVKPFLEGEWYWENLYNNWTEVCSGAVGVTFMLNRPELFDKIKDRINANMEKYLSSYKDDGVCVEGPGYWSYGFSAFVEYADMLRDFTDGKEDFFKNKKIKEIGKFFQKLYLDKDVILTYGDCGMDIPVSRGLIYKLKSIYGDEIELPPQSRLEFGPHGFMVALSAIALNREEYVKDTPCKNAEYYMADSGIYVKKTAKYGFGIKGGTNAESHNHNDVGSFIVAKNNKQVIIDMGGRPYTRQYFDTNVRYTYVETSSRGHNVPIINGLYQVNTLNPDSTTTFENGVFSVRYENAYQIKGLSRLQRDVKADSDGIDITNSFDFDGKVTFVDRLVSFDEPKIVGNTISIGEVTIVFDPAVSKASYSSEEHTVSVNVDGSVNETKTVYLTNIELTADVNTLSYRINA